MLKRILMIRYSVERDELRVLSNFYEYIFTYDTLTELKFPSNREISTEMCRHDRLKPKIQSRTVSRSMTLIFRRFTIFINDLRQVPK